MKKHISLLLTMMMALCACSAMAETADVPFEGTYVPFEDYGFEICLPNDWFIFQPTEEQTAAGVFYVAGTQDAARSMQLSYNELETPVESIDQLVETLSATYEGVEAVNYNGLDIAVFTIEADDVNVIALMGGTGIGMYVFTFYPASDADFTDTAVAIATSIRPLETEEAAE